MPLPGHSWPHPSMKLQQFRVSTSVYFVFSPKVPRQNGALLRYATCCKRLSPPHLFFAKFQQSRESAPLRYGGGHWSPRCLLPIVISLCPGARNSTGSAAFTTPFSCGFSSWESSLMWAVAGSVSPVCSSVLPLQAPLKCRKLKRILLKL